MSENNLKNEIDKNREELLNNNYFENNSEKYNSLLNKKFILFKNLPKTSLKLISKRKKFILYRFLDL